jgi:thioredoxin 1
MSTASRLVIVGALVLAVAVTVALRRDTVSPAGGAPASVAVAVPRLVDVGADKCIPCKAMVPVLEELRRECAGRLQVYFIDAWKYPAQAEPFKVYGIPVQIFLDPSGRELYRHLGFFSKAEILETWRRLGYPLTPAGKG